MERSDTFLLYLEANKVITSTTHFQLGRPMIQIIDKPTKQFVRVVGGNDNPYMHIYSVLEWATSHGMETKYM
ncbi:unnamed protein product [Leptidea sinapis]|uniref:Uncharacterized protein n=1 Tax=Leptidea sinapis TaxID=189913 RepID=A0A5E4Q978_9NEOP|nr:unnamed protein product [Leptidea sinapis]